MNKSKYLVIILCSITNFIFGQNQTIDESSKKSAEIKVGHDTVKVQIVSEPFVAGNHIIDLNNWKIDGKGPIGVDGKSVEPLVGIKSIAVTWAGERFELSKDLYNDVYSPSLIQLERETTGNSEGILIIADSKNESIMIRMMSFRWASAPYCIYWIVSRNGTATRFVQYMGT